MSSSTGFYGATFPQSGTTFPQSDAWEARFSFLDTAPLRQHMSDGAAAPHLPSVLSEGDAALFAAGGHAPGGGLGAHFASMSMWTGGSGGPFPSGPSALAHVELSVSPAPPQDTFLHAPRGVRATTTTTPGPFSSGPHAVSASSKNTLARPHEPGLHELPLYAPESRINGA